MNEGEQGIVPIDQKVTSLYLTCFFFKFRAVTVKVDKKQVKPSFAKLSKTASVEEGKDLTLTATVAGQSQTQ